MKIYLRALVLTAICSVTFSACMKDKCSSTRTYTLFRPVYKDIPGVKANIKSNSPREVQNPGKLFFYNDYIFLNEIDKGIHIIDNTSPSNPRNVAFIDIPGNLDVVVQGNILYADFYTDLVTIDITNPLNVVVKKYNEKVFPKRYYSNQVSIDSTQVIVDWIKKDTVVTESCETQGMWRDMRGGVTTGGGGAFTTASTAGAGNKSAPVGIAGSMSRLALLNSYLYTVGNFDLSTFNIINAENPVYVSKKFIGSQLETIYPFKSKLFIGANNGMFIYDVQASPANPVKVGQFLHVRACDPVIADDDYAYVTLHSGSLCEGFNNQLDIVKLNNLTNASLAKTYNLTSPHGLAKDGNILFICDGTAGLRVFNSSDVMNLQLIKQITNIETYDVIAHNNIALVVAKDGLYQYDYSNVNDIKLLSRIGISK